MKKVVDKMDKILKDKNADPLIRQQIDKKKEALTNNKTVKK